MKLILVNAPESVFKGDIARIDFDVASGMAKDTKAVTVVSGIEGLKIPPSEYFIVVWKPAMSFPLRLIRIRARQRYFEDERLISFSAEEDFDRLYQLWRAKNLLPR